MIFRAVFMDWSAPIRGSKVFFLAFCSACAAIAVTIGLIYIRDRKDNKRVKNDRDRSKEGDLVGDEERSLELDLELAKVLEENGHAVFTRGAIHSLLGLLHKVEDYTLEKLLVVLLNCSAFTVNQNIIRDCGGLHQLVGLLTHNSTRVSTKAAQVLSNLALNEENQEYMKDCISIILNSLEYHNTGQDEDVVTEQLKFLVNLSTTNITHSEIMKGAEIYINLLSHSLSEKIEREVLRLLVNLSCNSNNLERLLELKPLLILQTFMLPDNQTEIILRAVTITANLLSNSSSFTEQEQPTVTEHLNIMNGELIQLLDHSNEDIQSQAKRALKSIFVHRMMFTTQHDLV